MAPRWEERNAAYAQIDAEGRESEWVTHRVPCCDFAALLIYRWRRRSTEKIREVT